MYRLTALTSLSLTFDSECPPIEDYCVDLEKILMGFPCLKHLSVTGWCSKYAYENARVQADGDHILPLASNNDATAGSRAFQQHPLESLVINPYLIWHHAPESYSFIRRLGSLRQLAIKNQRGYSRTLRRYKPWNFGRAMKQYCPKLEAINLDGAGLLWLFDLPILPSNRVDHLAALIPEPSAEDAERMSESQLDYCISRRLQDQEINELVDGRCGDAFYPQLTTLILRFYQTLSAQDLILLGVQAPFLTHVDIYYRHYQPLYHWKTFGNEHTSDTPAFKSANLHQATRISSKSDELVENYRLRIRREISNQDMLLFLQLCSSLRYFALRAHSIPFEDLVDRSNHLDPDSNNNKNKEAGSTAEQQEEETQVIRRWACEETLESLTIGFNVLADQPNDHKLIWKHLGRFKKLRSLTFVDNVGLTHLIPSLSCGVEGLIDDELARTLQEIKGLPTWWEVEDLRETILWFARSCPKLRVLGLADARGFIHESEIAKYTALLEDGDIKQCSIPRVFMEK